MCATCTLTSDLGRPASFLDRANAALLSPRAQLTRRAPIAPPLPENQATSSKEGKWVHLVHVRAVSLTKNKAESVVYRVGVFKHTAVVIFVKLPGDCRVHQSVLNKAKEKVPVAGSRQPQLRKLNPTTYSWYRRYRSLTF